MHRISPLTLLQAAAVAVAPVSPPPELSLGAWLGLITLCLTMAGIIWRTAVSSTRSQNAESLVERELASMNAKLDKVTGYIEAEQHEKVQDAKWQGDVAGRLLAVEAGAAEAKDAAHRARNIAQNAVDAAGKLEARVDALEEDRRDRLDFERRTGLPDRRTS